MSLPSVSSSELVGLPPEEALEKALLMDLSEGVAAIFHQAVNMIDAGKQSLVRGYPEGIVREQVERILFGDALRRVLERVLSRSVDRPIFVAGINCHAVKIGIGRDNAWVSAEEQISWQNGVNGAPDC